METIGKIKELTEALSNDADKFYGGNKSAGTRVRNTAQDIKELLQTLRKEILEERKSRENG
jgi:collagenase-like PrtC family protease